MTMPQIKNAGTALLPPDYKPSDDEEYMSPYQLEYFRQKLIAWRSEIWNSAENTVDNLQEEKLAKPDVSDRASVEADHALELRTRDRQRKLIYKINAALDRIRTGGYGYCEYTGEPIGLKRLEARPVATLCLEAQERHEKSEKIHSDD